ncbi:hypothetical protein Trydic_g5671 [Trypoxylus dichotomus]
MEDNQLQYSVRATWVSRGEIDRGRSRTENTVLFHRSRFDEAVHPRFPPTNPPGFICAVNKSAALEFIFRIERDLLGQQLEVSREKVEKG